LYNKAVDVANSGGSTSFFKLKKSLLNEKDNPNAKEYPWLFDHSKVPRDAKDMAIHELSSAVHATKEAFKEKQRKAKEAGKKIPKIEFNMKYREKKDRTQHFRIPNNGGNNAVNWKCLGKNNQGQEEWGFTFWTTKGIGVVLPASQDDCATLRSLFSENGCKATVTLKFEAPNRWFLILPYTKTVQPMPDTRPILALDPGVRTFLAGYDSQGKFTDYGSESISQIYTIGLQIDKLLSKIAKSTKPKYSNKEERKKCKNDRKRWRKKADLLRNRIKNKIKDVHWKIANEMCQNYKHIMISKFCVSGMIKKGSRKINSETVRKMLQWSHFHFRQRLQQKAEEYGTHVHEVGEHYSSKTCGSCGFIHWKLGSNKTFRCPRCRFVLDRDWNGARNIFMMNIEKVIGEIHPLSQDRGRC
jgi:IS605 OrfB family transposase